MIARHGNGVVNLHFRLFEYSKVLDKWKKMNQLNHVLETYTLFFLNGKY